MSNNVACLGWSSFYIKSYIKPLEMQLLCGNSLGHTHHGPSTYLDKFHGTSSQFNYHFPLPFLSDYLS